MTGARLAAACTLALLAVAALSTQAGAQSGVGRLTGTVVDSLSGRRLAGARVELVRADDPTGQLLQAIADSLGRFHFDSLSAGDYLAEFEDPLLDSLTVQPLERKVTVQTGHEARLDLATPSGATLDRSYCGALADTGATSAVVGHLRDAATDNPIPGARIVGRTPIVGVSHGRLVMQTLEVTATANAEGSFLLCGLPNGQPVDFIATAGADSSGTFTVGLPASRILVRDVFVAPAATATGSIPGLVVSAAGRPIAGARVLVPGTARVAVADDSGRFVVRDVPLGTRALYTRAIGFFPDQRTVDVVAGTSPLHLRLETMQSVLDTVHVYGHRVYRERQAFDQRKRMGLGTFFERAQIEAMQLEQTTSLLRRVPGFFLLPTADGTLVQFRGGKCLPDVVLDGEPIRLIQSVDEINTWVRPEEVQAMEVYRGTYAPLEYQHEGACATIVIWTNPAFSTPIPK